MLSLQGPGYEKVYKGDHVFKGTHSALQLLFKAGQILRESRGQKELASELQESPEYKQMWKDCNNLYTVKRGAGALPFGRGESRGQQGLQDI